jgi:uncharacterized protein
VRIDLTQLDQGSLSFSKDLELSVEDLSNPVVDSAIHVHLQGTVRPYQSGYLVEGWFSCKGEPLCSRCLEPVAWQTREEFVLEYHQLSEIADDAEVALDTDDLNVAFIEGDTIDLKGLAVEQVELALPMRVVCDEQCAGLCPTCGGNRNLADGCSCQPETDPRWEALRDIKGRPER